MRVRLLDGGEIERPLHRHVPVQLDQPPRQPRLIRELDQPLAPHLLLDERRLREQRFEIAIFADQLGGGLDADARHARHIVDAVARQRLHLHDLVRRHPEFLKHLRLADLLVLHGVEHGDARADELHQVLVRGHDHHLAAGLRRLAGIGRDDVVGLEALLLDAGHVEGAHRVADQRELRHKLGRRLGPVRLVVGGDGVAEAHPAVVEDHGKVRGPLFALGLAQELPQHVAEAVHGADRQPVRGARQRRQRVEGAENVARAVDEIDAAFGRDGGCAFGLRGLGPAGSENSSCANYRHSRKQRNPGTMRRPRRPMAGPIIKQELWGPGRRPAQNAAFPLRAPCSYLRAIKYITTEY